LSKFKSHYPNWKITRGLDSILEEMVGSKKSRQAAAGR
jgi:hypothetical protein